jgi:D-xylose transport system permease protein
LVKPPPVEGVPYVIPVLLVLFVALTFVLTRTRYGRHVYAVGGNTEAARRAGINVDRIRISVFAISSVLAAVGGIMISSYTSSTALNAFGGNTLLLAVGAAVIGGTSLFGGRGRIVDALIGGAVVEVIYNGFGDLFNGNNNSAIQLIAVGLALALAATVDALSRRRAGSSGLA